MHADPSRGWDAVAAAFVARRSDIGVDVVRRWAYHLRPGGAVLDIGCGTGTPIAQTLADLGFVLYGIDASPTMLAHFQRRLPLARTACEAAEASRFFDRRFDGVVAVGLLFLLDEHAQRAVIARVGRALEPGGRFLFSAPRRACVWNDVLTGQPSVSLGRKRYRHLLAEAGLRVVGGFVDDGANDYLHAIADRA